MGRKEREAIVADSLKNVDDKDKAPQKAARKEREPDTVVVRSFRCENADSLKILNEYNKLLEAFLQREVFDKNGRVLKINDQDGEGNNRTIVRTTTIYFTVPRQSN